MKFSAYFPLLNHTEELEIEIKPTETPEKDFLANEIAKAKKAAKTCRLKKACTEKKECTKIETKGVGKGSKKAKISWNLLVEGQK